MERGDYPKALGWTWKLVEAALGSEDRDAMRRRVAELALGLADDTVQGIKALSQPGLPEDDSVSWLSFIWKPGNTRNSTVYFGAKRRRSRDAS